MNFYTSDLHLFHKNVTRAGKDFDHRPYENLEEMHGLIKEKWNAKVTNNVGCMMPYMEYEPRTLEEIVNNYPPYGESSQ